jgi:hypothetical protein
MTGTVTNDPPTRVEAGKNTSTVVLRIVIGDKREPSAQGSNWATLYLRDINTGTWPSKLEDSKETVEYGREFCETSTQE